MYYFDAKSDLLFMNSFKDEFDFFCSKNDDRPDVKLKKVRENIAKKTIKAIKISGKYGVVTDILSYPSPITGGTVFPVNIYRAILNDNSKRAQVTSELIMDNINQTIGQIEFKMRKDLKNISNPFFWIKLLFVRIVRIPFMILNVSGFNIDKIEDHFISKVFKLAEFLLIVWFLCKWGFEASEIKQYIISRILKC